MFFCNYDALLLSFFQIRFRSFQIPFEVEPVTVLGKTDPTKVMIFSSDQ